eukprot:m.21297 g.21297  ORF g.21297 m.21297 type:complete len:57 (-) comp8270_c0_seq2:103-273(-)
MYKRHFVSSNLEQCVHQSVARGISHVVSFLWLCDCGHVAVCVVYLLSSLSASDMFT